MEPRQKVMRSTATAPGGSIVIDAPTSTDPLTVAPSPVLWRQSVTVATWVAGAGGKAMVEHVSDTAVDGGAPMTCIPTAVPIATRSAVRRRVPGMALPPSKLPARPPPAPCPEGALDHRTR